MSGLNYRWKAEDTVAVTHLAHTLGVKIQESAFRGRDSIVAIESFLFDFFRPCSILYDSSLARKAPGILELDAGRAVISTPFQKGHKG